MRRIITVPVLVLHTADLPFGVYCVVLLVLSLYFPFSHWLNAVSFVLLVLSLLSSCRVVWFFSACSALVWPVFYCPLLCCFYFLVLFGIVRPSVGLVTAPSLVSVSIPVYLFFLLHYLLCVLVKVKVEGMEWGMGFEFVVGRGIWIFEIFWIRCPTATLTYGISYPTALNLRRDLNLRHNFCAV